MNSNDDEQIDGVWKLLEVCILVIIFVALFSLLYKLAMRLGWVVL